MPSVVSVFGVEPLRIGGTEMFARELSSQLLVHGWDSVLCFQTAASDGVQEFLNLPNTVLEPVGDTSKIRLESVHALSRVLRRHRPAILHLHFTGFLGALPWLAKMHSVESIFFTDHTSRPSNYEARPASWWKKGVARIINAPLTGVVCVSQFGYRCMTTLDLLPSNRHQLIYNGVDLTRISNNPVKGNKFRQKYGIPSERPIVLQVSWMIPEKGIADLLNAARLVLNENPNVHFVLVGEGSFRNEFMRMAAQLDLENNITWTGLIKDPFGEGVYDAADIVCQLSQWQEVFGWMIAEAMAYGKVVVASRVGGIPELVNDGQTGYLVDSGDVRLAAQRIIELVNDRDLRIRLGEKAKEVTSVNFNLRKNVSQLIEFYGIRTEQSL